MDNFLKKLRSETSELHRETEKKLLPALDQIQKEDYIFFLTCNYHFHQALERVLSEADFTEQPEWKKYDRTKAYKLTNDLEYFLNVPHEPLFPDYFRGWNDQNLLGAAYVSEGSSLGGQVILKNLKQKDFFYENKCGRFLTGNGRQTGMAWKSFLSLLERNQEKDPDAVIDGAKQSFTFFSEMIEASKKMIEERSSKAYSA